LVYQLAVASHRRLFLKPFRFAGPLSRPSYFCLEKAGGKDSQSLGSNAKATS